MSPASRPAPPVSRVRNLVAGAASSLAITVATLAVLEGGVSLSLFLRDYLSADAPVPAVRAHTVHDTLLGWVNQPGYANADEYGPGVGLSITRSGFRAGARVPSDSAAPASRVVCSGDSFTFGSGVADDRHWCTLLEGLLPGIRTSNLGEASYGFDQSALRYRRDGAPLAAGVHVFALTDGALDRAPGSSLDGWPKPYLELDGEGVTTRNVPVGPQRGDAVRKATAARALDGLRIVQEFRRVRGVDREWAAARAADARLPLVERVIGDMASADRERGGTFVLAYLPSFRTARRDGADERRTRLAAFAKARGIPFVDLTQRFHAMRADSLDLSFIGSDAPGRSDGAAGQLSRLGHAVVAREIAGVLARPGRERVPTR